MNYASASKNETSFRAKLLKEGDLITQKYTMIASDFDNGYDNWAPDNNTDNITYSDNPGKDSQKSQIFIADYKYDLGEQIVDLNVGMSKNETLHSYDSDWGNYDFWVNWDGDDHHDDHGDEHGDDHDDDDHDDDHDEMIMTIMMMIMMKILTLDHMISSIHFLEILTPEQLI
ncbi:MAG: hypothetical protein CM15mP33_06210 [Candidatus Neomarinimicrobiota bacterium]|nr:MAG: hypothetical protein CM15mP33_06210 [Candidatus Neomarinimicrobiota bacterium]